MVIHVLRTLAYCVRARSICVFYSRQKYGRRLSRGIITLQISFLKVVLINQQSVLNSCQTSKQNKVDAHSKLKKRRFIRSALTLKVGQDERVKLSEGYQTFTYVP